MGAVKTERKVVRLSHVAEYHWLPGLRHEGEERGKVVLRFLPEEWEETAAMAELGWQRQGVCWVGGDKVSFKQADWEGAADGTGGLSSPQVLHLDEYIWEPS